MLNATEAINTLMRLDSALENTMRNELTAAAKESVEYAGLERVYWVYDPQFNSRRMENGGLIAAQNIECTVAGNELTVKNVTGLQNLFGGSRRESLTNIVESGDARFHMQNAGARPFMERAKDDLLGDRGEQALRAGLAKQGILLD